MTLNPASDACARSLGVIYLGENKIDEAIEQFDVVLKRNPRNGATLLAAGVAYACKGDYPRACSKYLEPLATNAKSEEAKRAMELITQLRKADPGAKVRFNRQSLWPASVDE